jgi:hypothetical protein
LASTNDNETYDGPLGIWRNRNLSEMESVIEEYFARDLQRSIPVSLKRYKQDNGTILDTDCARALSSVWSLSHASKAIFCSAVHYPASAFISYLYERALRGRSQGYVVFMAGGGGSGKTAALRRLKDRLLNQALLIYDTTLSGIGPAVSKIEMALARRREVIVVYVHRPFQDAVRGVIERAILTGRTVPLDVLAGDHVEAPNVVLHIARQYAENNAVHIFIFDNSGNHPSEGREIVDKEAVLNFLEKIAYNDVKHFTRQARRVLEDEASRGDLPEYIVRALKKTYQRGQRA